MIVVDTSVWIDLLHGRSTATAARCEELLNDGAPLAITGLIRMELLQGVADDAEAALLARRLSAFPELELAHSDYELAAVLYRAARDAGTTVRRSLDCLIAAPCIRTDAALLHSDRDFDKIAATSALRVFTT